MSFELHPRLVADSSFAADWPLCRVLLMEDARYFWLILVPRLSAPSALRFGEADRQKLRGSICPPNAVTGVGSLGREPPPTASADARGGDWPVTEITDLSPGDRAQLMEEAARAGEIIKGARAAKLNIGALGNQVAQLHLHVVGRNPGDPAWPGPVWGHSPAQPYADAARAERIALVSSR